MQKSIIVLVGFLALSAAACGESNGPSSPVGPSPSPAPLPSPSPVPPPSPAPSPTPEPTPTPPPSSPFTQTISGVAERFENVFHDFTAPRAGRATMTLSWASGRDSFDLAFTEPNCRIDEDGCPIIEETGTWQQPGTSLQLSIELAEGQTVRIWVHNGNLTSVPYSVRVEIP